MANAIPDTEGLGMRGFRRVLCALLSIILWSLSSVQPVGADPDTITLERLVEWCVGCTDDLDQADIYGVAIGDATGDGIPEIAAVGHNLGQPQLSVFQWYQGVLTTVFQTSWSGNRADGVPIGDFDGVVGPELATVETVAYGTGDDQGEIRIWRWTGSAFDTVASSTWYDGPETIAEDLAATPPSPASSIWSWRAVTGWCPARGLGKAS